jgi:hypothetical protein
VVLIITVGMTDVMIVGMTATGMIVMTAPRAEIVPDLLPAVANTTIVARQGRHQGGIMTIGDMMIADLQGTMTGEEAMMTANPLIIIMTVVGMTVVMTEDAKKGTTKNARPGTQTEMEDGLVEGKKILIGTGPPGNRETKFGRRP